MTFDSWIVIIALVFLIVAFLLRAMRPGLILFSAAAIFMATGIITDQELIAGFSNNGVIIIVVLFWVNEAIRQSGLITRLAQAYLPRKRNPMAFLLPRLMVPVAFMSAFLNNLPIVVNISPVLIRWADGLKISSKKFLIPLSYAAIFGGMCSLIGTSSNLVVHGLMIENGFSGLHLFELAKVGGIIAFIGFVYMAVFGNVLLPGKKIKPQKINTEAKDYYYNLVLPQNSQLAGRELEGQRLPGLSRLEVHSIERDNKLIPLETKNIKLQEGDEILVKGDAQSLNYILSHKEIEIKGIDYLRHEKPENLKQYEVVLSPRFSGLGQTVKEFDFFNHFNAVILAVHRNGEPITASLNNLKLEVGDNVVLLAGDKFIETWESSTMFYLVNYVRDHYVKRNSLQRWTALIILTAMVAGIVINEIVSYSYGMRLNILVYVSLAAVLLVWLKILPHENYTRSVSWDMVIAIASAFAINKGIQNSGIAQAYAQDAVNFVNSLGPVGVLAVIYITTTILTEIITNNAAVALVFPVAVIAAQLLEVNPQPFFVAIAIAGAASFMTAGGYRANLLIKGFGKYTRGDFLRIGAPMQLIAFFVSMWLIPYFWPF
ncbi:TrkA-C domain-containing protein [Tangfeifania diversioriginum]|uniref:TrkA-C domain-containing protein n=1 Tax=Tangfeifania diversioriginum TaxID=1168035 RepID=A0A1M6MJ08_9BACT|nr:SLC13 family permease [Tangfeifania diversioriginum]SHJ83437.1 TrkA-C domain-containing protein [Tangfeifania diversioriginum]